MAHLPFFDDEFFCCDDELTGLLQDTAAPARRFLEVQLGKLDSHIIAR
jgi:hypothetical protein